MRSRLSQNSPETLCAFDAERGKERRSLLTAQTHEINLKNDCNYIKNCFLGF